MRSVKAQVLPRGLINTDDSIMVSETVTELTLHTMRFGFVLRQHYFTIASSLTGKQCQLQLCAWIILCVACATSQRTSNRLDYGSKVRNHKGTELRLGLVVCVLKASYRCTWPNISVTSTEALRMFLDRH